MNLALALLLCLPAFAAAEKVRFKTSDGWTIAAEYKKPAKGAGAAILVHGVGASKEEWAPLEAELAKRGLGTLAIDLRGHGESQKGEVSFPKAVEDLVAASRWLKGKGVPPAKQGFVGGSIGANLATQAAPLTGARWLVLLSPGLDYRGVKCAPVKLPTLAAAAPADGYAYRTARTLSTTGAFFVETKGGHGAQMLIQPDFMEKLGSWIEKASQGRADKR